MCGPGAFSSGKNRWKEASEAVAQLVPHVLKCDPDGISLYFFSNGFNKFENVKSADEVFKLFSKFGPDSGTNLANVCFLNIYPINLSHLDLILNNCFKILIYNFTLFVDIT